MVGSRLASDPSNPILDLALATRQFVERLRFTELEPFLSHWPSVVTVRSLDAHGLPVLKWLEGLPAFAAPETRDLTRQLVVLGSQLDWRQSYSESDFGASFLARYGWVELIGQRGAVLSQDIAVGFLLLGPETHYPSHNHAAEEVYVCLAGRASWQRGDGWSKKEPAAVIHHNPWVSHAMKTADEPLLALYLWRGGDLQAKPTLK